MLRARPTRSLAAAAAGCMLLAAACDRSRPRPVSPEDPVVAVGHRTVAWAELRARFARARPEEPATPEALKRFLQEVVEQELILAEADALGVSVGEAELEAAMERLAGPPPREDAFEAAERIAWREDLRRRLTAEKVVAREVTARLVLAPEAIAAAYEAGVRAGRFREPERVRARQVLAADAASAEAARARLAGGAAFEEVVREFASPEEAARGGEMGWIARGALPEAMDAALFALAPGERSAAPVRSPYGFHLFEARERREARTLPLAEAEPEVRRELVGAAQEKAYREWIAGLAAAHPVALGKDAS